VWEHAATTTSANTEVIRRMKLPYRPTMTCQTVAVMPEDHQIILADKSLRRWSPGKHDAPGVGYIPIGGRRKICTPRRVALHSHWIAMIGC
jgi:hypothetical protein